MRHITYKRTLSRSATVCFPIERAKMAKKDCVTPITGMDPKPIRNYTHRG